MAKHRTFTLDKFLKAVDSGLRAEFFAKYDILFPADINFDDDSLDKFWETIQEEKRAEIEEKLHWINDTADQTRDCLEQLIRTSFSLGAVY